MMPTRRPLLALATLTLALHFAFTDAAAQPANAAANEAAEVRQMIEALRRPAPTRNLIVRPASAPEAVAPAPPPPSPAPVAAPAAPAPAPVAAAPAKPPPAPAPVPVPTPPPPTESGLSLALPFQPGRAQLMPDAGPQLGTLLAALLSPELRDMRFVIEGHTDASGAPAQNLRLSQQRAEEVRQYLTAFGIAPARLRAVGKGATEPLNPANPRAAENRRVRIVAAP